jgi:hypothetical protein
MVRDDYLPRVVMMTQDGRKDSVVIDVAVVQRLNGRVWGLLGLEGNLLAKVHLRSGTRWGRTCEVDDGGVLFVTEVLREIVELADDFRVLCSGGVDCWICGDRHVIGRAAKLEWEWWAVECMALKDVVDEV